VAKKIAGSVTREMKSFTWKNVSTFLSILEAEMEKIK
jgi:hypothetical protein